MGKQTLGILIYANPDYYPPTVNAVYLLAEHFDVILIGRNYDPPDGEYPANVTIHRLGAYSTLQERLQHSATSKVREFVTFIRQSRRILEVAKVSVVYAYDAFGYTAACFCLQRLPKTVRLVYQNHEIVSDLASLSTLSGWVQRAERRWIHHADIVVFPDQDRATFFQNVTGLQRSPMLVPNFPLKSVFPVPPDLDSILQARWNPIVLFYRGWISDTSSMQDIVKATALCKQSIQTVTLKTVTLKFVGFINADTSQTLQNCVEQEHLADAFSYLGMLPYQDLQDITWSSTVGFALYKNTSFDRVACASACNKIYEYAACGLPVIVSDFPTYRSYLGGESWVRFANPDDPKSIYAAIQDILQDFASYRQLCLAARQAFVEKFNYDAVFAPLCSRIGALCGVEL